MKKNITYCNILATQGGQGPGWHNSTHLWGQTPSLVLWLLLLLYLRGFPQTSPHECGISRLSNGGSIIFPQKHRYSLGVAFLTNWHPGHLQPPSSVLDDESFDHFLIQWMWKTWKHSPSLEKIKIYFSTKIMPKFHNRKTELKKNNTQIISSLKLQ